MAICRDRNWRSGLLGVFSIIGVLAHVIFGSENHALAQITPDGTLGNNSSRITPNINIKGSAGDRIDGGAIRGANLFHSFQEFNVGELQRVYFANPTGISNILTRVTGSNISNILGILGVNGGANLFFLNPNGILFGNNARLDVAGSFVATTANSFVFGNGLEFSATNPPQTPSALLTVNPSALFFNQLPAGRIENRSIAPAGIDPSGFNAFGLRVGDGKSLLLVGGNVSMDGGYLNAYDGRVELGGVAAPGNVNLVFNGDNLSLKFPLNVTRADISLTNQAGVYVKGAGGGDIAVNARNVDILGGSVLSAGIGQGLGTPETVAGDITVNGSGEIKVAGSGSVIGNVVRLGSKGNGGNITIDSGDFSLQDGAQLEASTFGQGNAGNVTVSAKNAVSLADAAIFTTVQPGGVGKGGNIDINATSLSLTDGAQLASTSGQGNAGNVTVAAKNAVPLADSGIFSAVDTGAVGNAGNVNVKVTGAVDIAGEKNGLSSGIFSYVAAGAVGNGGNIFIDSGDFSLRDGAQLKALTLGQGNAGNIRINAKDAVTVSGTSQESGDSSAFFTFTNSTSTGIGGDITVNTNIFRISDGALLDANTANNQKGGDITVNANIFDALNGGQLTTTTSSKGRAGRITVNATDKVIISSSDFSYDDRVTNFPDNVLNIGANSGLFVNSTGSGIAGDIEINSPNITLDNQGKLNAESVSGSGGNINVNSDFLLLRHGAQISTNTGTAEKGGNGGNININSKFIVGVPNENTYISANAFTGIGGRVEITADGLFGLFGLFGSVPDLIQLPSNLVDASQQITQGCTSTRGKNASHFIATGRGGLPQSPNEPLRGQAVITGWVDLPPQVTERVRDKLSTTSVTKSTNQIVEAQGWIVNANGDIILVAQSEQSSSIPSAMSCNQ